jgi:hypothetical protein
MTRLALLVVALALLARTVSAQACSYDVDVASYGEPCAIASSQLSTLTGSFDGGAGCRLTLVYAVPAVCCNVFVAQQLLVIGLAPAALTLPGGCPLLVAPTWLVGLPPKVGATVLTATLPDLPVLVGQSLYVQGVVDRFSTIGFTHDLETTGGLALAFR